MYRKYFYIVGFLLLMVSCVSTKLTIKNINDKAKEPKMLNETTYELVDFAQDKKYAFHQDYPVNVGFGLLQQRESNKEKFLNALLGPNGEKTTYTHDGNCCPFPSDKSDLGGGIFDVYLITWEGNKKPLTVYLNSYEKGEILIPFGLTAKTK